MYFSKMALRNALSKKPITMGSSISKVQRGQVTLQQVGPTAITIGGGTTTTPAEGLEM
jgi:hypothetical protein